MSKYPDLILADSPECYWRLGTSLTDASGHGHTPSAVAGPSDVAGLIAGDSDGAKGFDGSTAQQNIWNLTYAPVTTGAKRTVECWLTNNKAAAGATVPWHLYGGSSFTAPQVAHASGNVVLFVEGVSQGSWAAALPSGPFGTTHLVATMDDANNVAELFVNGVSKGTIAMATAWVNSGSTIACIVAGFSGQLVNGTVDEFAVYNRILTASEIVSHYRTGTSTDSLLLRVRENPPLRLSLNVQPPSGQAYRWGRDEPKAANGPTSLSFTTTAPGGFESCAVTLPRRPKLAYPDLERLSNVTVRGAGGQVAWEGRIESVPRDSGSQMAVSPQIVGWQAHLEDNQNARALYVDRNLGNWGSMSRARRLVVVGFGTPNDGSTSPDPTTGIPALVCAVTGNGSTTLQTAEMLYDAGAGLYIGSIYYDFVRGANVTSSYGATVGTDDSDTFSSPTATANLASSASSTGTLTAGTSERYGTVQLNTPIGSGGTNGLAYETYFRRVTVWGNHGLPKRGTAPDDGLYASDVIAHALSNFAPLLTYSTGANGTVTDSSFIIPQLVFRDPTTAANIIAEANRFHLRDWFVWEGQRAGQPTFYYHDRGARGKTWRARVGPSGLSETGQSMTRLWNGVVVRYSDVDGTTKTVGPTGAMVDTTSTSLIDTDPLNPANKLGINRWAVLDMNGVSTVAGATEVGRRFLVETKALDTSGRADITGYITDDRGTNYPAWRIRAGDYINFVDASDTSARRVVRSAYDDGTKTCSVDLDAPPESLDSLLERLQVSLVGLGF